VTRQEDWVVLPERFVQDLKDVQGVYGKDARLPAKGILVFGRQDLRAFARILKGRSLPWNDGYAIGRSGRSSIAVARSTIGAPAAVINLEEAIVLGLRRVVSFGACGSIRKDLPIGSIVLPTRAYSDEGTSRHYGGTGWSRPDAGLLGALRTACSRRGIPFAQGATWTTDAPYRESRAKARSLAKRGVVCVEMEAAAVFQLAQVRDVQVASLFVVSDELEGPGWNPGFRDPRYLAAKRQAAPAIIDALRSASR